jgi:eukaryotic-like serine/threonine-protein kinase
VLPSALRDALADRYRLERELGAGGMATVYLAHDTRHDRPVAVKVLRAEHGLALGAERFDREIKLLARLRHPFVLPLHDSGEAAGALYFVMPYIDGESLRSRLTREHCLSQSSAVEIVRQVADALAYAHAEGVVHRDVKPENILLTRHGHALLADFGIARGSLSVPTPNDAKTEIGVALGTAAYMSPEQAMGEATIDGRSDVYALACVLYEMLAGRPPFVGPTSVSLIAQHVTAPAPLLGVLMPAVSPAIEAAITRALEKEPSNRFASATDFARALGGTGETPLVNARAGGAASGRLSVAVLPIVNMGGDAENEYFSDGMTEELTNALSKVEGLRVVSRTSTFSFKGKQLPALEIGTRLGVEFLIEGSVRRAGNRLRLSAKLIRVSDDSPLWTETYERTMEDVFAVQDDIARRIVETITYTLQFGHLRGNTGVRKAGSVEAYDLYLLGRYHWYTRSEAGLRTALDLFEQAAAADPQYAPAHSGIADACALLASWNYAEPRETFPRAVAAAERALVLDDRSADAHASLGFVKYNYEWDWTGAERALRRALELNPNHETAHRWLSAFLAGIGRDAEALPIAVRAIELNPVSVLPYMNLGIVHDFGGRRDDAIAAMRRVQAMDPGFMRAKTFLSAYLSWSGEHDAAIAEARAAYESAPNYPMFAMPLAVVLGRAGQQTEAREMTARAIDGGIPPLYEAMIHAAAGDVDKALTALERGLRERGDWMYTIGVQSWFRVLHGHPRFVALQDAIRRGGPPLS